MWFPPPPHIDASKRLIQQLGGCRRTQHADLPRYALLHRFAARVMEPFDCGVECGGLSAFIPIT